MAEHYLKLTCAGGGAGTSTATGNTPPIAGYVESIAYKYTTAPGTTTITVTEADGAQRQLIAVPAGNTNGFSIVRAPAVNLAGTAITNSFCPIYVAHHPLTVAIGAGNVGSVVEVWITVSGDYLGQ